MPVETPTHHRPQSFTRWLKQRRRLLDLTQDQLAELVGYAGPTLRKIERGERRPSLEMAERLVEALQIPAEERAEFLRLARLPIEPEAERAPPLPAAGTSTSLPLLLTRIHPPQFPGAIVARPRLTEHLTAPRPGVVTLVVAPAGWGKTTLLNAWLIGLPATTRARVAWFSLDSSVREPVVLLRYLIAALGRVVPALGQSALAFLEQHTPPLDIALRLLSNDLMLLPQPLTLIIDDYHLLREEALHQVIRFLVEQLPPSLYLIIASREDPPLPLARLRAQRKLHELRTDDLRFQGDEVTALFSETMGLALDTATITALEQRTEGWVTGLQLAALALRDQRDPGTFVTEFMGSHRLVLDYLSEEVLGRLPSHVLTFLLQTSILERLCGPLCDALLGIADPAAQPEAGDSYSQLLLAELERAHLFLIPLDEIRHWYRYHHLFGEVLRARLLRGAGPTMVHELHRRAAAWYSAQQHWHEALAHAITAQAWEIAARALEQIGEALVYQGALPRLNELIGALPPDIRLAHPRLLLFQGLCENKNYNLRAAEALFFQAADAAGDDEMLRSEVLLYLSDCQRTNGDFEAAKATLERALSGPLRPRTHVQGLLSRSFEALVDGDWKAARTAQNSALDLAAAHADPLLRFELAINAHSIFLVLPGGTAWSRRFCQLAADWQLPEFSPLHASISWLTGYRQFLEGDLDGAVTNIRQALELSARLGGLHKLALDAGFQQVFALALHGDLTAAEAQAAGMFAALQHPEIAMYARLFGAGYRFLLAWLQLQQGRSAEAAAIAADMDALANPYEWPSSHSTRLLLHGLLALENDPTAAIAHLQHATAEQQRFVDGLMVGDARMLLASALLKAGQHNGALETLREVLAAHIERGTPGLLLLAGKRILLPLLQLAQAHQIQPASTALLLAALGEEPLISRPAQSPAPG